ncbi:hypothetical protein SPJ1_1703 [Streptococcus parauberis KRS-02083]|uniref:Uncharacterized protein n=1 Tax=Streptococcus parauberis KRS-02083 TaxID=1207545 RepID=A0ABP2SXC9_9STRE|nr:hypothetical protein SPJ1_1703 [Streptococcus parauberis KRS-02083]
MTKLFNFIFDTFLGGPATSDFLRNSIVKKTVYNKIIPWF